MIGGGLGSACRFAVFKLSQGLGGSSFPVGTLSANLLGSLAIGILWHLFECTKIANEWRLFLITGFLGGFTTFSTYTLELTQLLKADQWKTAILYVSISNILGVSLVFLGYILARGILPLAK